MIAIEWSGHYVRGTRLIDEHSYGYSVLLVYGSSQTVEDQVSIKVMLILLGHNKCETINIESLLAHSSADLISQDLHRFRNLHGVYPTA